MKALVIGFGSIGKRHIRVLKELGHDVGVVSRREVDHAPCYSTLQEAVRLWAPGYVIIANRTSEHFATLHELSSLAFKGKILIEKPLFDSPQKIPELNGCQIAIAYNLRFHPLVQRLQGLLLQEPAITANIYCGSYLPGWRPQVDYRNTYSAIRSEGGGVLSDLSHELDYCRWLFGTWDSLTAMGGHFSPMEFDSDDAFSIILQTKRCPLVTIHLNYLDRLPKREIIVNTAKRSIRVDLVQNSIEIDGNKDTIAMSIDDTYMSEHLDMLSDNAKILCSLDEAMDTLCTIQLAEKAAKEQIWINP